MHHPVSTRLVATIWFLQAGCAPPKQASDDLAEDADRDGHTSDSDCDDANPSVHPGAEEACDALDNDCNGLIDDGIIHSVFADTDGDGHGSGSPLEGCDLPADVAAANDDCDDGDPAVSPSAEETCDGVDNNCDGETDEGHDTNGDGIADCLAPCPVHVSPAGVGDGSEATPLGTIADGIDALQGGCHEVRLGPGEYAESIVIEKDGLQLIADPEAGETVIRPPTDGSAIWVDGAVSVVLEGLTLTGGSGTGAVLDEGSDADGTVGGGLLITGGSVVGRRLVIHDNTAGARGGGVAILDGAEVTLGDAQIVGNSAGTHGGGVYVLHGALSVTGAFVDSNYAEGGGGGAALEDWTGVVSDSAFSNNTAASVRGPGGGGLMVSRGSTGALRGNTLTLNHAEGGSGDGGGLLLTGAGEVEVVANRLFGNTAIGSGGGIRSQDSGGTFGGLIANNLDIGSNPDAIVLTYDDHLLVAHNTIVDPVETGIMLGESDTTALDVALVNNLVMGAGTASYAVDEASSALEGSVSLTTNLAWSRASTYEGDYVRLEGQASMSGNLAADPLFVDVGAGEYCVGLGSPAVDAGTAVSEVTTDIEGTARPLGGAVDVGAYECL